MISSSNWLAMFFGVIPNRSVSFVAFVNPSFVTFAKASLSLLSEKHTPSNVYVKKSRFTKTRKTLKWKNVFCDTSVRIDDTNRVVVF